MDAVKTGLLLAESRKAKNLTQKNVAQRLHVSVQAVSKWERGLNFPDIALLEPLAELLDLTVSELLSGEKETAAGEELVRDSLRESMSQLGGKARRWRQRFAVLLVMAVIVGGFFSYIWVRNNTEWLPQKQTIVLPWQVDREDMTFAYLEGNSFVGGADIIFADSVNTARLQLELWENGTLTCCQPMLEMDGMQKGDGTRRTSLAYLMGFDGGSLSCSVNLGGSVCKTELTLPEIECLGWNTLSAPLTVDEENGGILCCLSLDVGKGIFTPQTGNFDISQMDEGCSMIFVRLVTE